MKLIINADDFGMSVGTTYGILSAMERGIVSSTTFMVNGLATELAASIAKRNGLNVGLHFNISLFRPLTDCPSLTEGGEFVKPKNLCGKRYDEKEIRKELQAQFDKFCQLMGKLPTHIDSHLYTHQKIAEVAKTVKAFAEEKQLPVRDCATANFPKVKFVDLFKITQNSFSAAEEKLSEVILSQKSETVAEIMVHPAFADDFLLQKSSYNLQRVYEYGAVTSLKVRQLIETLQIQLSGYNGTR